MKIVDGLCAAFWLRGGGSVVLTPRSIENGLPYVNTAAGSLSNPLVETQIGAVNINSQLTLTALIIMSTVPTSKLMNFKT